MNPAVDPEAVAPEWALTAPTLSDALTSWAEVRGSARAVAFAAYPAVPGPGDEPTVTALTWAELDARVNAVAAWCAVHAARGDRVAVLVPQSVDYVVAFLGVLRAGLVAVPLFEPSELPGHRDRLAAVLADCTPTLVLTTRAHGDSVENFLTTQGMPSVRLLAVDVLVPRAERVDVPVGPGEVAYLQYTSGSTRDPAGVAITHENVVVNARQGVTAYGCEPGRTTSVSWLPLYHDMGLVVGLATPVAGGFAATLLDPLAFLARPARWLEQLAATGGPAVTAAPNFAYGYVTARTTPQERARLRLDHVVSFGDGSEPVVPSTLDTFYEAFAGCGAVESMHRHTYGLAEAVVMVTVSTLGEVPRRVTFDRAALADGGAVPLPLGDRAGMTLVSAGKPPAGAVRIADPDTGYARPDGHVGEIWATGPTVGRGYWGQETESVETFAAVLRDRDGEAVPPHAGTAGWLRTGDLGVLVDGELYVTGRLKDLIIVDGQNHYPQDLELTVEQAHQAIRRHAVAVFSVPGATGDRVIAVAERARQVPPGEVDRAGVAAAVGAAVSRRHGVAVADVLVIGPGELPRTSSGKIQRSACRVRYLGDRFVVGG